MSKHGSRAIGFLLLDCILIALLLSGGLAAGIAVVWYWAIIIIVSFAFISGQVGDIKLQDKPMWCRALTTLGTIAVACALFYEGFYITFALYCISSAVIVGYYLFRRLKNEKS